MHVLGNMPIQRNYAQRILQMKIRTQMGKIHQGTSLRNVQIGLLWGNNRARYYRLLGNKLRETCDQNTGIGVREQHARGE